MLITAALEQKSAFEVTVTNGTVTQVAPTDLGKKLIIPSLKKWASNSPATRGVLKENNFGFESYADDDTNAVPIVYEAKDMKGWLINFHTS